jgi:hypothetical protein
VENYFPETQAEDLCPALPEKYNNLVIRQVEKICKVVVPISQV